METVWLVSCLSLLCWIGSIAMVLPVQGINLGGFLTQKRAFFLMVALFLAGSAFCMLTLLTVPK